MNKIIVARFVSRVFHLLAAGYIVGHLATFLWASQDLMYAMETEKPSTFYLTSGVVATLTGFLGIVLILLQLRSQKYYVTWEYLMFTKVILCLFLTRITDWMVLKYLNVEFVEELLYEPR